MPDRAHILADKELEEIEKRIEEIYRRANKEIEKKAAEYFKRFEAIDKQKRALVESGKMTEKAYTEWRKGKIMTGKRWESLKKQTAEAMNNANNIAADYVNGRVPSVYAINYNQVAKDLTGEVRGISFEMVDAHTVKNLATKDKTLLPYKTVNNVKDVRWNTQKVNSEILQGILQGESIPDLSKRLRHVTEMNRASSVRNARTAVTSAENKGRIDMLHDAEDAGVRTKKVWLSAHDKRTRDAHLALSGVEADPDEPFEVFGMKIMYPGDPDAEPEMVYNCRCTLTYKVVGFGASEEAKNIEGELITYSDKLDGEKWNESKSIINGLTEEYNTKLQEVRPGSHQSAGSVQISGTVMNLSSTAPEIAIHEFAHTISVENQTKFGLYNEADFWKEIKRVQRQYRKEVGDDASRWISAYEHGSRSTDEFMAEAFAQAKMSEMGFDLPGKYGKDLTYSMRVLEIIDKYFKRK